MFNSSSPVANDECAVPTFGEVLATVESLLNIAESTGSMTDGQQMKLYLSVALYQYMEAKNGIDYLLTTLSDSVLLESVNCISQNIQKIHEMYEKAMLLLIDMHGNNMKAILVVAEKNR